jgi:hypothetical protein
MLMVVAFGILTANGRCFSVFLLLLTIALGFIASDG